MNTADIPTEPIAAQAALQVPGAPEGSSAAFQVLGAPEGVGRHHNAPTSLFAFEDEALEAARTEWAALKKRTFTSWMIVGKGIRTLRQRADRLGGRKTFQRLMAEQGLRIDGPKSERQFDKTTAVRLLQVMEQETEVRIWHDQLPPARQAEWASPNAILRHCPIFAKPKLTKPSASPYAQLKQAHMVLLEENEKLKRQGTEHLFDPENSTDREIAVAMIGRLEGWRGRARKVARLMLELLDEQKRGRNSKFRKTDSEPAR
jgi:hypothetical protein